MARPKGPPTSNRSVRLPDAIWAKLEALATAGGCSVNAALASQLGGDPVAAPDPRVSELEAELAALREAQTAEPGASDDAKLTALEAEVGRLTERCATLAADLETERGISAGLRADLGHAIKAKREGKEAAPGPQRTRPEPVIPKDAIRPSQGASKHSTAPLPGPGKLVGYDWARKPIYR